MAGGPRTLGSPGMGAVRAPRRRERLRSAGELGELAEAEEGAVSGSRGAASRGRGRRWAVDPDSGGSVGARSPGCACEGRRAREGRGATSAGSRRLQRREGVAAARLFKWEREHRAFFGVVAKRGAPGAGFCNQASPGSGCCCSRLAR